MENQSHFLEITDRFSLLFQPKRKIVAAMADGSKACDSHSAVNRSLIHRIFAANNVYDGQFDKIGMIQH